MEPLTTQPAPAARSGHRWEPGVARSRGPVSGSRRSVFASRRTRRAFPPRRAWARAISFVLFGALASPVFAGSDELLREALRRRIEAFPEGAVVGDQRILSNGAVPAFYRARTFLPAWIEDGRPKPVAEELLASLSEAEAHGLHRSDYHEPLLRARLDALAVQGSGEDPRSIREEVDLELLLTDAFLTYAAHIVRGKTDPEKLFPDWKASRRTQDLPAQLETALETGAIGPALARLEPRHPEYARLRRGLQRYTEMFGAIGEGQDWPPIAEGPKLEPGDRSARVPAIRQRLLAEGYLDLPLGPDAAFDADGSDRYDEAMAAAIVAFQRDHGLDADGIVGRATIDALSRGLATSVDRIRVNLERWRWLPEDFAPEHIRVNIAAFQVFVYDEGAVAMTIPCIVGKTARKSPVFSGRMTYLVINPTWTVPVKLAIQDKLPQIRQDPEYLKKNGFEVFEGWGADARPVDPATVDWSQVGSGSFPYRLRQRSGEKNALGRIKFMFPNPYDVYLHDTPSRELFAKSERTFSSGCIRVQDPIGLAAFLLRGQAGWTRDRIESTIASNQEKTVFLEQAVPVHLLYWTAWTEEDGTTRFRKDVYDRDGAVLRALDAPPPSVEEG